MKSLNKFFCALLFVVASIMTLPYSAQAQCCNPCGCDFDFGVDFLWWKPCMGDLTYCGEKEDSDFKLHSICTDWEPGFRIFLGRSACFCDWDVTASYTYLSSCTTNSVENDENIAPTHTHTGFIISSFYDEGKGTWDSCYNEWDIMLSFDNSCGSCHQLTHSFGVAGIYIEQELKFLLEDTNDTILSKWNGDYWGVGFRLGTDYRCVLCDCINFFAGGHASLLAGESDSKSAFDAPGSDTDPDHTYKDDEFCYLVPGCHLFAGVSYDSCYCDWDFSLRFGYEFLAWYNIPSPRTFVGNEKSASGDEAVESTLSDTRTYGLHGLFVGLQLNY